MPTPSGYFVLEEANYPTPHDCDIDEDPKWLIAETTMRICLYSRHDDTESTPGSTRIRSDIVEIEGVLGEYDAPTTTSTLYTKNISSVSKQFGWEYDHLEFIVSLHEHAHATVHFGSPIPGPLKQPKRTKADQSYAEFSQDDDFNELLAQVITYNALRIRQQSRAERGEPSDELLDTFLALAAKQPYRYRIGADEGFELARERLAQTIDMVQAGTLERHHMELWKTMSRW